MFIRIRSKIAERESLYECQRFSVTEIDRGKTALFNIEGEGGDVLVEVGKENHDVFVMNNEGKTIDRYIWPQELAEVEG